jgi:hypothetical protein
MTAEGVAHDSDHGTFARQKFSQIQISNSRAPRDITSRSRRAFSREFYPVVAPLKSEGAGNAGRSMHPQPRTQGKKAHERSHHGHTGNHPAFPAQWFYGVLRALPGDEFVLPPSPAD